MSELRKQVMRGKCAKSSDARKVLKRLDARELELERFGAQKHAKCSGALVLGNWCLGTTMLGN